MSAGESIQGKAGPRPGYLEQIRANIRRFASEDRQALIAFRQEMYGRKSERAEARFISWLYEDPSYAVPGGTLLWVYSKDGRVQGQQGAIRVALKIGEQYHPALWGIDLMVTPPLRMRGVGAVLNEIAYEEVGLNLGVEVSEAARKAFVRAGYVDLGIVPLYVRPLDASALLGHRWSSYMGHVLGRGANLALRVVQMLGWTGAALTGLRMEEITSFDARVDQLSDRVAGAYPVFCRRDHAYLNWRFARYPEAGRYRSFLFHHGSTVVGYAVLRTGQHHGVPAGHVVDFLCAPEWTYGMLARCIGFFQRRQLKVVSCVHQNPHPFGRAAFSALGFARRTSGWPLMFRARDLSEAERALVSNRNNWFLTGGDSDLDRPRERTTYAPDHNSVAPALASSASAGHRYQQ